MQGDRYCKHCGYERNGGEKFCPRCGTAFNSQGNYAYDTGRAEWSTYLLIALSVVAIATLGAGSWLFFTKDNRKVDEQKSYYVAKTTAEPTESVEKPTELEDEEPIESDEFYDGVKPVNKTVESAADTVADSPNQYYSKPSYSSYRSSSNNYNSSPRNNSYSTNNYRSSSSNSGYYGSSSSMKFLNGQYVVGYLAHQTFTNYSDIDIRFDGDGRIYIDGDYAGVVSVIRFNETSAMLRYSGGMYGEGRIGVRIENDRLQLRDPLDGTTWYQKKTHYCPVKVD